MRELWRDVVGYEGLYKVSNLGRVYSNHKNDDKKQVIDSKGYHMTQLYNKGKKKNCLIHRLVAEAFIENPLNKKYVNHKDGNKSNNSADNLEWVTRSENELHAYKTGLKGIGENNQTAKLSNDDVRWIRENYIPRHKIFGQSAMARKFGVSRQGISNIIRGKTWRAIK